MTSTPTAVLLMAFMFCLPGNRVGPSGPPIGQVTVLR